MFVEPLNVREAPLAFSTVPTLEAPVKMVEPPKLLVSEESVFVPVAEVNRSVAWLLVTWPVSVTSVSNTKVPALTVVEPW